MCFRDDKKQQLKRVFVYNYMTKSLTSRLNNFCKCVWDWGTAWRERINRAHFCPYLFGENSRNLVVLEKSHSRLLMITLQTYPYFISDY